MENVPFVSADWLSEITRGDWFQTRQAVWVDDFGVLSETLERDDDQSLVHAAANGFVIHLGAANFGVFVKKRKQRLQVDGL